MGIKKSMVFTNYMGCVAKYHGMTYALCFVNVAEFKRTKTHPAKWEAHCGGNVTDKGWGFEAGSIGPGNTNLTILVAHGTFLNRVLNGREDANRKYKGVRVLALTSALAKLQVEKGTLHTIAINNILYTQEMDDLMKTDWSVSWSTLTTFLDKFSSMVTDPTVVSKSKFTVAPVRVGEDIRPTILVSALIGAICLLLSEAAVFIFFLCNRISNSRNSEQSNVMRKELRKFKIGDDINFIMQLVAEERLRTGSSIRPSATGAGVELLRDMYGDIGMGLAVNESSFPEEMDSARPENDSTNKDPEIP